MPIRKRLWPALLLTALSLPLVAQATGPGPASMLAPMAMTVVPLSSALARAKAEAERGDLAALVTLADAYHHGRGTPADRSLGLSYDRRIVERFPHVVPRTQEAALVVHAMIRLAASYADPVGKVDPERSVEAAIALLTHGASYLGSPDAQFALGTLLLERAGDEDHVARRHAARWLLLAARKGHADAQHALGRHLSSQDAPASRLRGAHWLEAAAKAGADNRIEAALGDDRLER